MAQNFPNPHCRGYPWPTWPCRGPGSKLCWTMLKTESTWRVRSRILGWWLDFRNNHNVTKKGITCNYPLTMKRDTRGYQICRFCSWTMIKWYQVMFKSLYHPEGVGQWEPKKVVTRIKSWGSKPLRCQSKWIKSIRCEVGMRMFWFQDSPFMAHGAPKHAHGGPTHA